MPSIPETNQLADSQPLSLEPDSKALLQAADWYIQLQAKECTEVDRTTFNAWLAQDASHAVAYGRIEKMWANLHDVSPNPRNGTE
ncbi:FecR/PupR family sigma factor regulator [Methylobacillus pratensis]